MLTIMQAQPAGLQIVWFFLIATLWIGFFLLEGFDFGVAMLYPVIGKDPKDRRVMVNSIGTTWDGNEVWLLTAGGATFAAFPGWYATLFSGLYIPLLLVLLGLIIRGISFEYRSKVASDAWRNAFDACATIGSFIVTLVFGVGFANFIIGLPVAPRHGAPGAPNLFTGSFWSLFSPFALLGGVMLVALFLMHGAVFLSLRTYGRVHDKAVALTGVLGPLAFVLLTVYVLIANIAYGPGSNPFLPPAAGAVMWLVGLLAVAALGFGVLMQLRGRNGLAFAGTAGAVVLIFVMAFVKMYGTLGFVSADPAKPLDMITASSSPLTLKLMTIFTACILPIVMIYQGWTYWIFRQRLSTKEMPDPDVTSDYSQEPAGASS